MAFSFIVIKTLDYLLSSVFGASLFVGAGVVVFTGTSPESNAFDSVLPPLLIATLDNKINANKSVAKAQVLLSKKSPVFLTPPNCCVPPPPNDDDNPPPVSYTHLTLPTSDLV